MKREEKNLSPRNHFLSIVPLAWALLLLCSCAGTHTDFDEKAWREKVMSANVEDLYAPNHDGDAFFNPWMPMERKGFLTFLRWRFSPGKTYTEEEKAYLPRVIPEPATRIREAKDSDFIFWVGHGTFFMRLGGTYWITDPMFSDRALLPKRRTPPGISMDEIHSIVGDERLHVLISHNHYDHLDRRSIEALPANSHFFVPLGLKDFVLGLGHSHVLEMNWWQFLDLPKNIELVCLPMQHWSRRIGQGFNTTLWASFLIAAPNVTIYFDGDGGYHIGYREIGRRFPGIDYALIPTTAYHPRWFMHYAHMNIDETLDAFQDLGASFFIPTQWGTFELGDEPAGYPRLDLERTIAERKLNADRFLILDIGGLHLIH